MLLALSFLSGAAGLVYEVLWARRLALVYGSTALAQTAVLTAFLGGLSAGSWRLGRLADASASPARFYARLEWAVAALGLAAPILLRAGGVSVLVLIAQAFLMGGTIPALCRAAGGGAQDGVGRVYAANSAGAALGCLAAAFFLIPAFGLDFAFAAAAALNAAAALGAPALGAPRPVPRAPKAAAAEPEATPALAAGAVFLSGFVALAYEIAWTRVLALTLGSSVYSFAEMLAAFIAGAAAGSLLAAAGPLKRTDPARVLGLALIGAGASVLLTLPFYDHLPVYQVMLRGRFGFDERAFYAFEAAKFALCLLPMLVPALCLGMTLPAAVHLAERDPAARGAGVGAIFAANTAGNVLGALAGWLVLPWLGVEGILRSGTTVFVAAGAAVLWLASPSPRRRAWALAGLAALLAYRAWLPRWDQRLLDQGFFRSRPNFRLDHYSDYTKLMGGLMDVVYSRDDREATVTVSRFQDGTLALKVNGKSDASTGPDMRTQILLGELPLLLKPGARSALLVGWGSGVTAGSLLRHPLERLDAVELIPSVVEASDIFRAQNGGARSDPRLNLTVEDAKSFLAREGPRYDAIVSEPSNPWMAGVGDLFSAEFYARARARLAPDGVMVQWFHAYEMDDAGFAMVLRTFRSQFPSVTLWNIQDDDLLLVGSAQPLKPDFAEMERRFRDAGVRADLARADVGAVSTLLSIQSAGEETARAMAGDGPLNRELGPRLEYEAPKAFFRAASVSLVAARDDRADPARRRGLLLDAYFRARGRPAGKDEFLDRIVFAHAPREMSFLRGWLDEWKRRFPGDPRLADVTRILRKSGRL